MTPVPEDGQAGCTYYLTLMRDDDQLQVRAGECFYVIPPPQADGPSDQSGQKTTQLDYDALLKDTASLAIFRVERLFVDSK